MPSATNIRRIFGWPRAERHANAHFAGAPIVIAIAANNTSSSTDARAGAIDARVISFIACSPVIANDESVSRTIYRTDGASAAGTPNVRIVNVKVYAWERRVGD